jgi:hypothetical protein
MCLARLSADTFTFIHWLPCVPSTAYLIIQQIRQAMRAVVWQALERLAVIPGASQLCWLSYTAAVPVVYLIAADASAPIDVTVRAAAELVDTSPAGPRQEA